MKMYLLLAAILLLQASIALAAGPATSPQLLSIIDDDTSFIAHTRKGPVEITRIMTSCAKNRGWLQPLVPIAGVHPVGEIEILNALNDKDALVVDMRKSDDRAKGSIPGSISIPYTDVVKRMEELGCIKNGAAYDCRNARKIYAFCNGPVCPQSPMAMAALVRNGFPPDKLYYYRGGMLDWEALGLTTVRD